MIVLLLLAVVAVGAYWAGTQSRRYRRNDASYPHAGRTGANDENSGDMAAPVRAPLWPWVLGMVVIAVLLLGFGGGAPGMFGGSGLFGGPGGGFAALFGP